MIPGGLWSIIGPLAVVAYLYLYKRSNDRQDNILKELKDAVQALIVKDAVQDVRINEHDKRLNNVEQEMKAGYVVKYNDR